MISIADVRERLCTVSEARDKVAPLEGLGSTSFEQDGSSNVRISLPEDWNSALKAMGDNDVTLATITLDDGPERQLTKSAALKLTSEVGITKEFMARIPGPMIEPIVNHLYSTGEKSLQLVHSVNVGLGVTRAALLPLSMTRLINEAVDAIHTTYGADTEILVDKRMNIGLDDTTVHLIVPEVERSMHSKFAAEEGNDPWSAGIMVSTSLLGMHPTEAAGYLLRYTCTNGQTTTHGTHKRKRNEDRENIYSWAKEQIELLLGGMEHEFDAVDALNEIELEGELAGRDGLLAQIYSEYRVPKSAQSLITDELVESDDITGYGLQAAITRSAQAPEISWKDQARLMAVGGVLPHALGSRCPQCHSLPHH